jgi:hypothetical protein
VNTLPRKYDRAVEVEYNRLSQQADRLAEQAFMRLDEKSAAEAEALQAGARQFRNRAHAIPEVKRKIVSETTRRKEDFDRLWPAVKLAEDYHSLLANTGVDPAGAASLQRRDIPLLFHSPPMGMPST